MAQGCVMMDCVSESSLPTVLFRVLRGGDFPRDVWRRVQICLGVPPSTLPQNSVPLGMTETMGGLPAFVWIGGVGIGVPGNLNTNSLVPGLGPQILDRTLKTGSEDFFNAYY